MARKTTTLILLMAIMWVGAPLPVNAGWSEDAFAPCMISMASDSLVRKYLVKKGDTIWKIAQDSNVDVDIILAMNKLVETDIIHEGQRLDIPGDRHRLHRLRLVTPCGRL